MHETTTNRADADKTLRTSKRASRWRLLGFSLAATAVFISLVSEHLSTAWAHAMRLELQSRMSHQVLPAETVIYTEDPIRITALQSRTGYRNKAKLRRAAHLQGLPNACERVSAASSLEAWSDSANQLENYQVDDTFGYQRTSAGGIEWIVKLDQVNPFPIAEGRRKVTLTQQSFQPVDSRFGSRWRAVSYNSLFLLLQPSDTLTVFAPQPDPDDGSRVNVPYELNGQAGLLDGVVTDNGYVKYSVRTGNVELVKWNTR